MGFSISGGVRAWRFDDLDPEMVAAQYGWKLADSRKNLTALRTKHADPAWIDATLAKLSVPSLAILAVLVECGGYRSDRDVLAETAQRFRIGRDVVARSVRGLLDELLVVVLTSGRDNAFSLVEPSAALVAMRLRDADIPPLPTGAPFLASDRLDDGRALLAVCGALEHVEVKLTQSASPHRAGIKRVAKSIGVEDDTLDRLVTLGLEIEVLAPTDEDVIRPVHRRLRELAFGRVGHLPILASFVERLLAAGAPVQVDLVDRWTHEVRRTAIGAMPRAAVLGSIPGLCHGRVGEVDVIAAATLRGSAAVSITPSFEVFVPPESRYEHLVDVLACAELVRLDRVVVARITKASVRRAAARGGTAASITASLGAASRTPVPQNVAAAIEDWASGQVAVTAVGRVIVVPVADAARAVGHLDPYGARVIAPGVVIVDADTPARAVIGALARIGITVCASEAVDVEDEHEEKATIERLPPLAAGDPEIRQRFAAYQAGQPGEVARVPVAGVRVPERGASVEEVIDDDEDAGLVSERAYALIEGWEDARGCTLSDEVASVVATLLDAVAGVDQRFLLASKNAAQMEGRVRQVLDERGGFEAFIAKNRDLVIETIGPALADLVAASRPAGLGTRSPAGALTSHSSVGTAATLDWHSTDLYARLVAAARTCSTYTLDLGGNRTPTVRIRKVIERGTVTMVLGEDISDDSAIAVPISTITRIAEPLSPSAAKSVPAKTVDAPSSFPMTWRPLEGQMPPAGHVPCPCGSGVRYRACCRLKN